MSTDEERIIDGLPTRRRQTVNHPAVLVNASREEVANWRMSSEQRCLRKARAQGVYTRSGVAMLYATLIAPLSTT